MNGLSIPNPFGSGGLDTLQKLLDAVITFLYYIAGPVAVVMIVASGVLFLFAKGDTGKIKQAKDILLYAIVGLAIILIGSGFIKLIKSIFELGS